MAWLPVLRYSPSMTSPLNGVSIVQAFFQANVPAIVFEEFLFRGFLWGYLRNKGMGEWLILLIQAIFFWMSHHKYLLAQNFYFFWIPLPLAAVLLGYLVLKSKSLTSSSVAHFLFNFTTAIIRLIYI
jgi:membrane protease YdiL (CAAX protease family)